MTSPTPEAHSRFLELQTKIAAILFRFDPIGLAKFGVEDTEYDLEAATITRRLYTATSVDEVQLIVFEEFLAWFESDAGTIDRYRDIAIEIAKLGMEDPAC